MTYGLFKCNTILLVEVSHINKSCILGLETYLVEVIHFFLAFVVVVVVVVAVVVDFVVVL